MYKSKHLLESEIEAKLVKGVKALGGMALKWVSPGKNGVPDRIVFLPGGRVIFVELKADDGNLRPTQRVMQKKLKDLGVDVRVVKGVNEVDWFISGCAEIIERDREVTELRDYIVNEIFVPRSYGKDGAE